MSKLTKAQRDALPASSYGDPERRLFPIVDCSDVSDAATLLGKAKNQDKVKARIISLAKAKNCTIPDAWKEPSNMSVTFALEDSGRRVDGDWAIYPNALLFQAGDYEDKDFSMSPEEMWLACDQFSAPVGGNIEHSDFLKGRACEVRSIRLDDADSSTLRGEVAVPLWLDSQLEDHERKLSCEWDRGTKTLSGIGLVVHPRVPEAALMSAYATFAASRHDTPQGQMVMQDLHNVAARGGAVCSKGNANMASRHEATVVQQVHDLTAEHGATCASVTPGQSSMNPYSTYAQTPASTATAQIPPKEGRTMSWKDRLLAAISGMPDDDGTPPSTVTASAPPVTAPPTVAASVTLSTPDPRDAELARMRQERDAAQAETNRIRAESISREAVAFADRMLTDARAFPAEREAIITAHQQAAIDDVTYGVVTFGDGQTTTRVARFEAAYAARPAHQLTAESLSPALMSVLQGHRETPAQDADRKATPEELEKLLNMTPQGQTVVAMSRGTNSAGHTNGRA
jgi:hypothetical protein